MLRTVILSVSATLALVALLLSLFLNSLLGAFGLAATSLETLAGLRGAQAAVEHLKAGHQAKKKRLAKRYLKKSGRRIATSALAAATIGTAAVIATVAVLETNDYCEEQEDLLNDEKILYGHAAEFSFEQCLETAQDDYAALAEQTGDTINNAVADSGEYGSAALSRLKAAIKPLVASAGHSLNELWDTLYARLAP